MSILKRLFGKKPKKILVVNMDTGHCFMVLLTNKIPKGYEDLEKITRNELWFNLSAYIIKSKMGRP